MQALGLIETRGLLAAIECADVMLKTAQVDLAGKILVGGGLVTIAVTGEVGAVNAAVEAGIAAADKIGHGSLISKHIIPRPDPDIELFLPGAGPAAGSKDPAIDQALITEAVEPVAGIEEHMDTVPISLKGVRKAEVDAFVQLHGPEKGIRALQSLSVVTLRKLAREYKDLDVVGRAISKANKDLLIQKLTGYYERGK